MAKRRRRKSTAPAVAQTPPDNRVVLLDALKAYLRRYHRSESMDAVLARPCDAIRMGVSIAATLGMLRQPGRAKRLADDAARYAAQTPDDVIAIHRVLQAGMAARKRGELRITDYSTSASTPAVKED